MDGNNNLSRDNNKSDKSYRKRLPDIDNIKLPRFVRDELSVQFHPGSLVWAKVPGHSDPYWPGVVMEVIGEAEMVADPDNPGHKTESYSWKYR